MNVLRVNKNVNLLITLATRRIVQAKEPMTASDRPTGLQAAPRLMI
jgi:hypothetical protein